MNVIICPDCKEQMVKAKEENQEGDWGVRWLCGCKVKVEHKIIDGKHHLYVDGQHIRELTDKEIWA